MIFTNQKDDVRGKSLYSLLISIAFIAAAGVSCKPIEDSASDTKFRPFDTNAKNIFYVAGAPNGLAGVKTDVDAMTALLKEPVNGWNWQVITEHHVTNSKMLDTLRRISAEAGDNGSVGLYVSGHGSQSGMFMTEGGMIGFRQISEAIASGRTTAPLKRLITFNDSCYSGNWVDGNGALGLTEGNQLLSVNDIDLGTQDELANRSADAMYSGLYSAAAQKNPKISQYLVMSAASKSNTSLDWGSSRGGAFTYNLRQTYAKLRSSSTATVGDLARDAQSSTRRSSGHHTPQFRAFPESMLSEPLIGNNPNTNTPAMPSPTDIWLALGKEGDLADSYEIYAAGTEYLDKVGFCKGTLEECKANPKVDVNFTFKTVDGEKRRFFKSDIAMQLVNAQGGTIIGWHNDGKAFYFRHVTFQSQ